MSREHQIRLTHADCINRQDELLELLQRKINRNIGFNHEERENFSDLIANALYSQGWIDAYHSVYDGTRIPMGSVHSFALRMKELRGSKIRLKFFNKEYIVDISDLWRTLYEYLIRLFPRALEEALHVSREIPQREESTSYIFKSDEKIG